MGATSDLEIQQTVLEFQPVGEIDPAGHMDVVLNSVIQSYTAEDVFQVVPSTEYLIDVVLEAPDVVAPDELFSVTIRYTNAGLHDLPAPIFVLSSDESIEFQLPDVHGFSQFGAIELIGHGSAGSGHILRSGESRTINVLVRPESQSFELNLQRTESSDSTVDYRRLLNQGGIDPTSESGERAIARLTKLFGHTWAQYHSAIRGLAIQADFASPAKRLLEFAVTELFRDSTPSTVSLGDDDGMKLSSQSEDTDGYIESLLHQIGLFGICLRWTPLVGQPTGFIKV